MERFTVPDTYAVWSKNSDTRFYSTSGGAFTEFARAIIADGGCVAGAKYNNENLVEHDLIDNFEDIEKLRQSKYMSSSMGNIYKRVKAELVSGRLVGFCGSPCQVAGLYSFLGKEYDNLFTMDFICRGMNSPKAFKAWLNEIEHREGSKVIKVWFKYKEGLAMQVPLCDFRYKRLRTNRQSTDFDGLKKIRSLFESVLPLQSLFSVKIRIF